MQISALQTKQTKQNLTFENDSNISGLDKKFRENLNPENIAMVLRNIFIYKLGIEEDNVDALKTNSLYSIGRKIEI